MSPRLRPLLQSAKVRLQPAPLTPPHQPHQSHRSCAALAAQTIHFPHQHRRLHHHHHHLSPLLLFYGHARYHLVARSPSFQRNRRGSRKCSQTTRPSSRLPSYFSLASSFRSNDLARERIMYYIIIIISEYSVIRYERKIKLTLLIDQRCEGYPRIA